MVDEDHNDSIAADKDLVATEPPYAHKQCVNYVNDGKRTMANKTLCWVHAHTRPGMLLLNRWERLHGSCHAFDASSLVRKVLNDTARATQRRIVRASGLAIAQAHTRIAT